MTASCPCCSGSHFFEVASFAKTPYSGVFRATSVEEVPFIDLEFRACDQCGLVRRERIESLPDYGDKTRATERQLPAYREKILELFHSSMASKSDLIVEIGSNDGSFLTLLRDAGFTNVLGVEPSTALANGSRRRGFRVEFGYFGQDMAENLQSRYGPARAVICRHTLEHIPEPLVFVSALHKILDPGSGLAIIEVPDGMVIPEKQSFFEFWDEHLFYFNHECLPQLLKRAGFKVLGLSRVHHLETRNLLVHAKVAEPHDSLAGNRCAPLESVRAWREFPDRFRGASNSLRAAILAAERPLYLIGASHPQSNFVNFLSIGTVVDFMIDDDPDKLGKFPPLKSSEAVIISTSQFTTEARAGTVLSTGFGYPRWTENICRHAMETGMTMIDPRIFLEQTS